MFTNDVRKKLENIIAGISIEEHTDTCTSIRNRLCTSFATSPTTKRDFEGKQLIKEEQSKFLQKLATSESLWISEIPADCAYLTHGGEAQVYINPVELHVLKLNDAVYYATWLEYFNSLVIHASFPIYRLCLLWVPHEG